METWLLSGSGGSVCFLTSNPIGSPLDRAGVIQITDVCRQTGLTVGTQVNKHRVQRRTDSLLAGKTNKSEQSNVERY